VNSQKFFFKKYKVVGKRTNVYGKQAGLAATRDRLIFREMDGTVPETESAAKKKIWGVRNPQQPELGGSGGGGEISSESKKNAQRGGMSKKLVPRGKRLKSSQRK